MVIDRFYFSNGDSAGSLDELLGKLKVIGDECFSYHVNEDKNDFANWIEFCVGDKALGKKIRNLKDKGKIVIAIDKKVNTPARVKGNIISQIKGAILHGAS